MSLRACTPTATRSLWQQFQEWGQPKVDSERTPKPECGHQPCVASFVGCAVCFRSITILGHSVLLCSELCSLLKGLCPRSTMIYRFAVVQIVSLHTAESSRPQCQEFGACVATMALFQPLGLVGTDWTRTRRTYEQLCRGCPDQTLGIGVLVNLGNSRGGVLHAHP